MAEFAKNTRLKMAEFAKNTRQSNKSAEPD
jgi:hypothetical protein